MKTIIPFTSIAICGVWHNAPRTLSSLDEAIAALGIDCATINNYTFTFNGRPRLAYRRHAAWARTA